MRLRGLERDAAPRSRSRSGSASGCPSPRCQRTYAPRSAPSAVATSSGRASAASAAMSASATGPAVALERDPPGHRRLVRVAGPDVPEVRDRPQRHVVLDRLVRRAVLADGRPSRASRPRPTAGAIERREPHGRTHVVREDQERRAVRASASPASSAIPFTIEPIACSRMPNAMLRPACVAEKTPGALELGLRRLDEVGGAADHRRRERLERLHHLLAGVARGDLLAGREHRQRLEPAGRAACRCGRRSQSSRELRERLRPALEAVLPLLLGLDPALGTRVHVLVAPRRGRRSACPGRARAPPSRRGPRPRRAARRAPSRCRSRAAPGSAMWLRTMISDGRSSSACAARDRAARARRGPRSRRRAGRASRSASKRLPLSSVVKLSDGRAVDRDVVVVVEVDEPAEAEVAGDRRGLLRDALHQVAVGADRVDRGGRRSRGGAGCSARRGSARRSRCRRRSRTPGRAGPSSSRRPACARSAPDGPACATPTGGSCFSSSSERS